MPVTAQEVTTQFWPEIDTFIRLGENSRLYVPLSRTREGIEDSNQDGTTGIYFDYYVLPLSNLPLIGPAKAPRTRKLQLRAGYGFTAGNDGVPSTHTIEADLTWRRPLLWQVLLSDRNRFDLNFTGGKFDPRYRNRLRLERDNCVEGKTLTTYAYGEFFYSFDRGSWFRSRVAGGLEVHLWERFVPEIYFQRDVNAGAVGDVNGIGLVLSIYVR